MSPTDPAPRIRRKLTTILAADAARFSEHMGRDEAGTYAALHRARDVFDRLIDHHGGRIANTAGDGLIADFPSVVEAVTCAIAIQQELGALVRSAGAQLDFRIGIHLGDVIVDGEDLLGDGVNLAARLEQMAEPGGILISRQVYDQVHSKLSVSFEPMGEQRPKNFVEDVEVYRITTGEGRRGPTIGVAETGASPRVPARPVGRNAPTPGPDSGARKARFLRLATGVGIGCAGLAALDLVTGGGMFVQWPILAALIMLGVSGATMLAPDPIWARRLRYAAIAGGVVLINLVTWSGVFWAAFPMIGFAMAEAMATFNGPRNRDLRDD